MTAQILYRLLQNWQLDDRDPMFQIIKNDPEAIDALEAMAADFDCRILLERNTLYLIPNGTNQFLGYSKTALKEKLLKTGQSDVHYYLLMFMLLVLLDAFFSTEFGEGKARNFLLLGDWMNRVEKALNVGSLLEGNPGNIPYEEMQDTYNNLLSEMDNHRKGTKLQLYFTLLKFLQEQNLAVFSEEESQIYVTERMEALIGRMLSNEELLAVFESLPVKGDSYADSE